MIITKPEEFEVGERYIWYWTDSPDDKRLMEPLIFVGSGKDSYKLYKQNADYRKKTAFVIMTGPTSWHAPFEDNDVTYKKLTKLEKALK